MTHWSSWDVGVRGHERQQLWIRFKFYDRLVERQSFERSVRYGRLVMIPAEPTGKKGPSPKQLGTGTRDVGAPLPFRVKNGNGRAGTACPFYPPQQTSSGPLRHVRFVPNSDIAPLLNGYQLASEAFERGGS
jgi:hypothetical protein